MSVDWTGYSAFDPGISSPLHELPRREARSAYERLMKAIPDRISALSNLLAVNGIQLGDDDVGIQEVNDWFRSEVEGDRGSARLDPMWYAVVNDLALFLGEVLIRRGKGLEWRFFEAGKRSLSYQRHVIMGFEYLANPNYSVDIDLLLAMYGQRIVAQTGPVDEEAFISWVRSAVAKSTGA